MDFLLGWTLHEMVLPSSTLTQRTMYDCSGNRVSRLRLARGGASHWRATHLAMYLELLDAGHRDGTAGGQQKLERLRRS